MDDAKNTRKFGIQLVGDIPWGTHLCQFYQDEQDLIDILVPYFAEGLRNNEFCMWITSPPLEVAEARASLQKAVPQLDSYFAKGQIEIVSYNDWYLLGGKFDSARVLAGWVEKETDALNRGFDGLRLTGNTFWIERNLWQSFVDYEEAVNSVIGEHKMLALCTYCLKNCTGTDVLDVVRNHIGTLIKQGENWTLVEDTVRRKNVENSMRANEQRWLATVSSIGDAVIATDVSGNITFMNRVSEELTGWGLNQARAKPLPEVFNIVNEYTRKEIESPVIRVLKEGTVVGLANHTILLRRDGSEVAIDDSGAPIRDKDGNITGVVLVFRDITERKNAEEAVKASEERYRSLFSNMINGFAFCQMVHDKNGKPVDFVYLQINDAFERITGLKRERVLGKLVTEAIPGIKESNTELFEIYGRVASTGKEEKFELFFKPLSLWLSISVYSPQKGYFAAVFEDISTRKKAEEELRGTAERLNRSQEIAHLGSWELDITNNKLTWSDEVYRIFGLKPQEFDATYEAFLAAVHPDDRAKVDDAYAGSLKEGRDSYEIEHRVIRKGTGEVRMVHEKCEHVRDVSGRIIRSIGMVHDITDQKIAEESLLREKAFSESAINSLPGVFYIFGKNGKFLRWNRNFEKVTGYSPKEISQMTPVDFFDAQDKVKVGSAVSQVFETGSAHVEASFVCKNGSRKPYYFVGSRMLEDNVPFLVGEGIDITERMNAETALRESEQRWSTTLSSIGDAVIATNLAGNITFMNRVAEKLTGWTLGEGMDKTIQNVFCIVNENTGLVVENPVAKVLEKGMIVGLANHTVLIRKDGSEVPIDDSGAPIKGKDGKITGVVLVFRDITERRKAEEALKRINEELERRVQERTAQVSSERQRLYNVLETLPAYVVLLDKDYRVPFANKVFRERFGESHGSRCYEYLFKLDAPCENCETYKVLKTNNRHHWEWAGPDGRNYDIYDFPFVEADGSTFILEMGIDITERKRAQAELEKHREHLEELVRERTSELWQAKNDWERTFDSVPDLIAILDDKHRIVRANEAMARQLGITTEQAVGLPCYESVHGTTCPPEACPHAQTLEDGKEHVAEVHESRLGGHFLVSTTPLRDEEGKLMGSVHVARNITERRKAEETLRKQAALIDLSPDAIIVRDPGGRITSWSVGAEKMYGWTRAEVLGQDIHKILNTSFPDESLEEICDELKQKGKWSGELIHQTKDGRNLMVQSYWLPRIDTNGNIVELLESNVDITDRKQMQNKLEEYAAHLEELVQERTQQLKDVERLTAIGETAGMVGHDLRNPLQTVTGEAFLAKSELNQLPECEAKNNLQESIAVIAEQISYMDKIVSDLQDFVRPIIPDKKTVDLQKLLTGTLAELKIPKNIESQVLLQKDLPELVADGGLLKRVFFNLFNNAVQAMPEGGTLSIQAFKLKTCGPPNIKIIVQDTGSGIPDSVKPKIFKPLFTTKSKGQGFGLAVCKRVIEAHGGTITFQSEEGKGTAFTVELPTNEQNKQ